MEPTVTPQPKMSRFRRGMELTKSSWRVLKLDKELMALPSLSLICSVAAIVALVAGALGVVSTIHSGQQHYSSTSPAPFIVLGICFYIVLSFIGNFFSGAVIYGATQRFRGGDPTIRSSLAGAGRKIRPLLFFSLVMTSIGLVLQMLEERVPFAGKIALWLAGAAWNIANVFAIPVIVLSDKDVQPFEATKESVGIIRKVWGESVTVDLGITFVGALSIFGYVGIWILLGAASANLHVARGLATGFIAIAVIGLTALLVIFATLTSIAKAALYHFATTGEAPELFSKQLLQASMTPKKARRIFA